MSKIDGEEYDQTLERGQSPSGDEKDPTSHEREESGGEQRASLWDILRDEAGEEIWDGWVADGKWFVHFIYRHGHSGKTDYRERISNFLAVPLAVEKITLFGALLCLDGFLYHFTVLPIRAFFALYQFVKSSLVRRDRSQSIPPSHLHSIIRLLLVLIPTLILLVSTDASKMYHSVRGQDTIKLYVIFNALEVSPHSLAQREKALKVDCR